jgi:hypothetical protein
VNLENSRVVPLTMHVLMICKIEAANWDYRRFVSADRKSGVTIIAARRRSA